jgi:hypothetical protein
MQGQVTAPDKWVTNQVNDYKETNTNLKKKKPCMGSSACALITRPRGPESRIICGMGGRGAKISMCFPSLLEGYQHHTRERSSRQQFLSRFCSSFSTQT